MSLLPPSDVKRYHWTEHSESCGALSEHGRICKNEPKAATPSNSNKLDALSSPLLLIANCNQRKT